MVAAEIFLAELCRFLPQLNGFRESTHLGQRGRQAAHGCDGLGMVPSQHLLVQLQHFLEVLQCRCYLPKLGLGLCYRAHCLKCLWMLWSQHKPAKPQDLLPVLGGGT